ncbi:MAG TPA: HEAT repeat domain-containing protein [Acidimicrobiales bacterium]|nr:HEAT repeat domain-containing protein [Acidimicrobiales bacterium]
MSRASQQDVVNALYDSAAEVRRAACELATRLPPADFKELLDDPDPRVVEACAFALGECEVVEAVPALIQVVKRHSDPLCRETAVSALGIIGDDRARTTIIGALNDAVQIRRRALIALANFSGEDVRLAMEDRLTDRDWQVRQAAEDLLGINEEGQT